MERYPTINVKMMMIKNETRVCDEYAGKILSVYIIFNALNVAVSLLFEIDSLQKTAVFILGMCYFVYLFIRSPYNLNGLKRTAFLYFGFIFILFLSVFSSYFDFQVFIVRFYWLFGWGIPLFLVFCGVTNTEIVLSKTVKSIYATSSIALLIFIQALFHGGIKGDYSMALGYALLYPTLLLIRLSIQNKQVVWFFLLGINLFVIVSYGSRGAILCIGFFLLMFLLFGGKISQGKRIFRAVSLFILGLFIWCNLKNVIQILMQILETVGVHSRSLGYFLERPNYTGRELVWDTAIGYIQERPVFGWTTGVDISVAGFYPHNIFLEFLLHYGVIIGGLLSFVLVVYIINNIIIFAEHDFLTLLLCSWGFVPLLITSEYILWPSFWAFSALCISRNERIKRMKIST